MKKFTKGALTTIVEDDDRRMADYIKAGWKEELITPKPPTEVEVRLQQAIQDANGRKGGRLAGEESKKISESLDNAAKTESNTLQTDDKKINEVIKANNAAKTESEEIDDGLFKKEEASKQ